MLTKKYINFKIKGESMRKRIETKYYRLSFLIEINKENKFMGEIKFGSKLK